MQITFGHSPIQIKVRPSIIAATNVPMKPFTSDTAELKTIKDIIAFNPLTLLRSWAMHFAPSGGRFSKYSPAGKLKTITNFRPDGKTKDYITEHSADNTLTKMTQFRSDGKTTDHITEYFPRNIPKKLTQFRPDGKTTDYITKYISEME